MGLEGESWGIGFGEGLGNYPADINSVIGCLVDQSDFPGKLSYTLDGKVVEGAEVIGLRGPIVPAVSISAGAEIEVMFQQELLSADLQQGYSPVILSQNYVF